VKALLLFLLSTVALGQSDREVTNRSVDQDTKLCVNDGGTISCGVAVDGPTGDVKLDVDTLRVDSANDRVGVGTAAPAEKVHVQDDVSAGNVYMQVENTNSTNGSKAGLKISTPGGNGYVQVDRADGMLKLQGAGDWLQLSAAGAPVLMKSQTCTVGVAGNCDMAVNLGTGYQALVMSSNTQTSNAGNRTVELTLCQARLATGTCTTIGALSNGGSPTGQTVNALHNGTTSTIQVHNDGGIGTTIYMVVFFLNQF
jgi:hypothetical protein